MGKKEAVALVAAAVTALMLLLWGSKGVRWDSPRHHRFKPGDRIPFYGSKVGPLHNPSETYRYSDLPFCSPEHVSKKREFPSEALVGSPIVDSVYELQFQVDYDSKLACKKILTKEDVARFRNAVIEDYILEMFFDGLPIWAFLGKRSPIWAFLGKRRVEGETSRSKPKYLLNNCIHFNIFYNNDTVIEINVQLPYETVTDITEDKEIEVEFSYTVKWSETSTPFEKRMEKYTMSSLSYYWQFHLFSTIISCSLVLFLTIFLAMILVRVLKNDFVKYARDDHFSDDQEETGWKHIHGDVFRFPKNESLFAACLGSGTQLLVIATCMFIFALLGILYPYNQGNLFTALMIYVLTSGIAGYTSVSFYCQFGGTYWIRNLLLTGCLSHGPLFLTLCLLNSIATVYNNFVAFPWSNFGLIFIMWALVSSVLLGLGGIIGKNRKTEFEAPCRTTKCPREIPVLPWYRGIIPQMAMAGLLHFSAIYFELYYVFASLCGLRYHTMCSILLMIFIILLIVTAFINVEMTYFQLAAEDHHWWWRSFLCGGCTGLFIFGYSFYYYHVKTEMSGLVQTSFFFGYMACISYGIFLILGTVGFLASLFFVRHIYRSIKCE